MIRGFRLAAATSFADHTATMVREILRRYSLIVCCALLLGAGLPAPRVLAAAAAANCAVNCPAPTPTTAPVPKPLSGPHYLLASQVDLTELLPPPPAADSPAQQADLQAVLEAQRAARGDGSVAHAVADAQASCGRFADVVGDALTSKSNSRLLAFLDQAAREGASITGPAKQYWKRTRPYAYSGAVERLGDMSPDAKAVPQMDTGSRSMADMEKAANELAHSSYPSGHATFGMVCTILLADMVPEKRAALFARNLDYDHSRMVLGAHYPTDLAAGRIAGTLAAQLLLQNANFQRALAEQRSNLRAALGLPAALPDLEPEPLP
jgi:acid phosphatase (class A)